MTRPAIRQTLLLSMLALGACAGTEAPGARDATPDAEASADPNESFEGSAAVWEAARERGVGFRAVGQEPGWVLEIYPQDRLHILADYGALEFDAPWADPVRDEEDRLIYTTSTPEHRVRVIVRDVPCSDTMSGEGFPNAVVLEIDDRALFGCGRTLE